MASGKSPDLSGPDPAKEPEPQPQPESPRVLCVSVSCPCCIKQQKSPGWLLCKGFVMRLNTELRIFEAGACSTQVVHKQTPLSQRGLDWTPASPGQVPQACCHAHAHAPSPPHAFESTKPKLGSWSPGRSPPFTLDRANTKPDLVALMPSLCLCPPMQLCSRAGFKLVAELLAGRVARI